ncbi:PTS sugar transporter subunit IIA [Oenococcus kitaharae]|uniref:Phosphotransferase system, mannose/fructose-specific component IIA n=1 Tax=Oenococcus kitaharae DSM 17330 TaxID=1045004 RepID=G9WHN5_9LACO|nr:PTS N-acetylglucosamine transporter subunit IIBC [Oenococcus kitaharae]EHN58609.1 phosphotransferase system, mannose/fructose-specific component IIA [Oenococcus kitaharae DSM 17330]OEY84692.1 PTS N-acetylglucosamine transporter subunit IIBC [Oenococcus kitaharae]OEY84976.1 PTS N-acetylglucosamine transporter subunit IIBC [Oenococcus kitaharae]OEY85766.1 PTS N-acetylglucosamine transporter subunit IIBC [Oenococcus kitaharae]
MKRHYIIASHSTLSAGMAEAAKFFIGDKQDIKVITAYVDNQPVDAQIASLFKSFPKEDEVVMLTDIMAGSVNQKAFPYIHREHTHIVSGFNLALVLGFLMEPESKYISHERAVNLVADGQKQVIYMNDYKPEVADDDE